jgi:hypothetical protein
MTIMLVTAIRTSLSVLLILFSGFRPLNASNTAQSGAMCFKVTGINNCVTGRFREFWERNGGLTVFGYPITPQRNEQSHDDGKLYEVQWFERARFELHPELPQPYDVLLGRIGDDLLLQQGTDWKAIPAEKGPKPGCRWFAETRHNVCDQLRGPRFKTFWETHGVQGSGLGRYQRSLALFGLPLTEARMETNFRGERVLTQWFERARLEYHPSSQQNERVLLGAETYPNAPPPPSVNAVVRPSGVVRLHSVVRVEISGFDPNEETRFWLTNVDRGTNGDIWSTNIGPTGRNYILWDTGNLRAQIQPGLWAWTIEGVSSQRRSVAYIKVVEQ